ncbi:MAG: hypothetical protein ACLU4E_10375, partial [Faecalibacterium prausnitzii]
QNPQSGQKIPVHRESIWLPRPFIDYTPFASILQVLFSVFPIKISSKSKAAVFRSGFRASPPVG